MNTTNTLHLQQLSTLSIVQPHNTALLLHHAVINSVQLMQRISRISNPHQPQVLQAPDAAWFAHYE